MRKIKNITIIQIGAFVNSSTNENNNSNNS